MENLFIHDVKTQLEERLKLFEARTGCDLLLVVTDCADPYPAAPLRFGIFSSFILHFIFGFYFEFQSGIFWPISFFLSTVILTQLGRLKALKRLVLDSREVQRESREKAIEYFHTLGTSRVNHKSTVLIMLALFEHRIELLIDETLKQQITQEELNDLVNIISSNLRSGHPAEGLNLAIETLEAKILQDFGGRIANSPQSQIADTIHFMRNS